MPALGWGLWVCMQWCVCVCVYEIVIKKFSCCKHLTGSVATTPKAEGSIHDRCVTACLESRRRCHIFTVYSISRWVSIVETGSNSDEKKKKNIYIDFWFFLKFRLNFPKFVSNFLHVPAEEAGQWRAGAAQPSKQINEMSEIKTICLTAM